MSNYRKISVKRGERGKPGYRQMLVKVTEEQLAEIAKRMEVFVKEHKKESVSNEEHADIVFRVLNETREE